MDNVWCESYGEVKDLLMEIAGGEDIDIDLDDIKDNIESLYEDDIISEEQHDELLEYLQDL